MGMIEILIIYGETVCKNSEIVLAERLSLFINFISK